MSEQPLFFSLSKPSSILGYWYLIVTSTGTPALELIFSPKCKVQFIINYPFRDIVKQCETLMNA